nr:LytS/YhcK type 5TM receptor domain-containing protein [Methanobacterium formicicum]
MTIKNQLILILIFGGISIYGSYSGVDIFGAVANVRDLGPMVAGLIGGPIVGLGAGLIGGLHRLTMGGFTCIPCSLSTILAGVLAGIIYLANKKTLCRHWRGSSILGFDGKFSHVTGTNTGFSLFTGTGSG